MSTYIPAPQFPGKKVTVQQVLDMVKKREFDFGHATEILSASTYSTRQHPEIHIMETGFEDHKPLDPDWHIDAKTKGRPMHSMFRSAEESVDSLIWVLNTSAGELALGLLSTVVGKDKPVYIYSRSAADEGRAQMAKRKQLPSKPTVYELANISWVVTGFVRGKGDYLTVFTHYPVETATMQDQVVPPEGEDLIEYVSTVTEDDLKNIGKKKTVRKDVHHKVKVEFQTY